MGVLATNCVVCALPLQQDHYVASEGGMLKIYRGGSPEGGHVWEPGERPFRFRPEHAWIAEGVGLRRFGEGPEQVRGPVQDGSLVDGVTGTAHFVGDGDEDYLMLHAACWACSGSPSSEAAQPRGVGRHSWSLMESYQAQLFDFEELAEEGKAWALADPLGTSAEALRSRARIDAILLQARRPTPKRDRSKPASVADLLASDDAWSARVIHNDARQREHSIRLRANVKPGLDVAGYPALLWLVKAYDGDAIGRPDVATRQRLEDFEVALKAAVETDGEAILVTAMVGRGQGQYIVYAKDEQVTRARIDALPGRDTPKVAEYDNELDPQWTVIFHELNPNRAP